MKYKSTSEFDIVFPIIYFSNLNVLRFSPTYNAHDGRIRVVDIYYDVKVFHVRR